MSAKGAISGSFLKALKVLQDAQEFFLEEKERTEEEIEELLRAVQAFNDKVFFRTELLKPKNFGDFLSLTNPTQAMFNQLASEIPRWFFLDQIEESCFLQSSAVEKARPFIDGLWKEVAKNPFKPPAGWKYLPVEEAVEAYRKLFGSGLRADSVLKLARDANPRKESEGLAIWPKISFLAKHFGVSGNPLEDTEEGWKSYARIVDLFIPEVGKAYIKAYPEFSFRNWREGQLTAKYVRLTPAGRRIWQKLESESEDDFVIASYGAVTGSLYAGHSVCRSRIAIVLSGNQFGQDAVMAGGTIVVQPNRLTKFEHLCIDCPGTKYVPGADGEFSDSLYFRWDGGGLHFGCGWAVYADQVFGSGSGFLG